MPLWPPDAQPAKVWRTFWGNVFRKFYSPRVAAPKGTREDELAFVWPFSIGGDGGDTSRAPFLLSAGHAALPLRASASP